MTRIHAPLFAEDILAALKADDSKTLLQRVAPHCSSALPTRSGGKFLRRNKHQSSVCNAISKRTQGA